MMDYETKYYDWLIEVEDEETPSPGVIYIVGQENNYHLLKFICPCGCGDVIRLNLLDDAKPQWKYLIQGPIENPFITITPSIQRLGRCRSHFNITNGKVH